MSAADLLRAAKIVGLAISLDGDDLVLTAAERPSTAFLKAISREKVGIVALLRKNANAYTAEDWFEFYEERAAILEFDADLPRELADLRAMADCLLDERMIHAAPSEMQRLLHLLAASTRNGRTLWSDDIQRTSVWPGDDWILETTP